RAAAGGHRQRTVSRGLRTVPESEGARGGDGGIHRGRRDAAVGDGGRPLGPDQLGGVRVQPLGGGSIPRDGNARQVDMSEPMRNCEGVRRRDFLKLGVGSFAGMGFVDLLRQRAAASEVARVKGKVSPNQVNCILLWLDGGPSHYETFDPKPDAPADVRGELKPIKTAVPGAYFSEVI